MLDTDPQKQFDELKSKLLTQIKGTFPIKDAKGRFEVRVKDLEVIDEKGVDDIRGQLNARVQGTTWAAPVMGTVEIVDSKGKVLVSKPKTRLAAIPKMTRHYGYIFDGREMTIANQWRLKPGAYVKSTEKEGEFEAQFQLAKGKQFDVKMEPQSGYMSIAMGGRKIPIYAVLKAAGVSDEKMKSAWGADTFEVNKKKASGKKDYLASFSQAAGFGAPKTKKERDTVVQRYFAGTKVDPEVMKTTLGVKSDYVNGEALFKASKKLLDVSAGKTEPDAIDALQFKELWTPTDHLTERLAAGAQEMERRVRSSLGKKSIQKTLYGRHEKKKPTDAVRDVLPPDLIQKPIYHVFATSLANEANQINPIQMLSDKSLVTIKGPGGIQNEHAITYSNTSIDPSQLGYVDPVFTPEGKDTGVTLHLAAGVKVKDRKPHTKLYNLKTGKVEDVPPDVAARSTVVLPDQITWKNGKPKPTDKLVRVSDTKGKIVDKPFSEAQYAMITPSQAFAIESNLVPFMQNDSAHRSTMSARHMGQAISVVGREPPAVQVEAAPGKSFEEEVGSRFLAHKSPADGTVVKVERDHIVVKDSRGKTHEVDIYDHYPLNDKKSFLESTPRVKVGDKVKKGQPLADNNFTKDGKLALGANLRTAYLANGANHEDGIVISETAAKKLGSEHLYKPSAYLTSEHVLGKEKFRIHKGTVFTEEQFKKIGDDGLVKPGTIVKPGDPLILALGPEHAPDSIEAQLIKRMGRIKKSGYTNAAKTWDHDAPGEVVRVVKSGKTIKVHVKTVEPMVVGSKMSTRHSAKGIVAQILPDEEMPKDKRGRPVEMLINPVSVPGRMNPGQILETVAGKIAEKTGKPYIVKNFDGKTDYLKKIKQDLKKHGLSETEPLYDPKTGRKLGDVTVGPHYAFQLVHQIDKKSSVRSGGHGYIPGLTPKIYYDQNLAPAGGGATGAQSLSGLGIYAGMVAGLKSNLKEMQTLKSDLPQAEKTWDSLTRGEMLPTPEIPFVYKKFEAYMKGVGLNVQKEGSYLRLIPQTDKEVLALSSGEVKKPDMAVGPRGGATTPDKGGIFDDRIFGGVAGKKWGHIKLAAPMPNPIFAEPTAALLGVKKDDLPKIVAGKKTIPKFGTGPMAIEKALRSISVDQKMKELKSILDDPKTKGAQLNQANRLYKSLRMLKDQGIKPHDGYMVRNLPVLPPIYRPYVAAPDRTDRIDPLNNLYRRVGQVNVSLRENRKAGVPMELDLKNYGDLYQEVQNLMGTTPKQKKALDIDYKGRDKERTKLPGILHTIAGDSPKDGFFQKRVVNKKQDFTSRATIVADPGLAPDEIGVPQKLAIELMRPLVVRELARTDPSTKALENANRAIQERTPEAIKALERVVETQPVLMKRDPVLHAYGLIGQKVKLTKDPAIKVSPLVLPPINGDVDGDTVALFVPLSNDAKKEVEKLMPSHRHISDSSGDVLFKPSNEAALSLYRTSIPRRQLKKSYASLEQAERDFHNNKINLNDGITINGVKTTLGRARLAKVVPDKFKSEVMNAAGKPFDKTKMTEVLQWTAKNKPQEFAQTAHQMSQLGFKMAYESGHSVTLKDLEPLRDVRDRIVGQAKKEVEKLKGPGTSQKATQTYLEATKKMHEEYKKYYEKHPTNISDMWRGKIKAKDPQFQGLVMAPMVVQDHLGRPQKTPVTRSFAEGIGVGDYWMQAQGARRGVIQKTQEVSEPGYFTKLMTQVNVDQPITSKDCGTKNGVMMSIDKRDIIDRVLASPVKLGTRTVPAGTPVTPDMLTKAHQVGVKQLAVRSPIKCRMPQGVCSKCMGLHPTGDHYEPGEQVGLAAAQALGERASQIMLRQTHGGGIVTPDKQVVDDFGTVQSLMFMSKENPTHAAVATKDGTVQRVVQLKQGGYAIYVTGKRKPYYSRQKPLPNVKPGYRFRKGEKLTKGDPNVHTLLKTQGVEAVQSHMVNRIGGIYAGEGIKQRHVELAVRSATNLYRVDDPGDHPSIIRGDYLQKTVVDEINRTVLKGKRPIRGHTVLKSIAEIPHAQQKDWMGALAHKNLVGTLTAAAREGRKSDLLGRHPIPGIATGTGSPQKLQQLGPIRQRRRR